MIFLFFFDVIVFFDVFNFTEFDSATHSTTSSWIVNGYFHICCVFRNKKTSAFDRGYIELIYF